MIFGLIPMQAISFLSQEFRQSYLIYPALSIEQLEQMIDDMEDYKAIKQDNERFTQFWKA